MSVAANRYAKALIDVLFPHAAEAGLTQLQNFSTVLAGNPDAGRMLENPTVPTERRKGLLEGIGKALGFAPPVLNFLNLLVERNRLDLLDEIVSAYQKMLDELNGIVHAVVTSARPLESAQQKALTAKLQDVTGKQVRMELSVDPALVGGLVAQVGSTIYDGSLRQQLQTFRNRLIQD